MIILYDLLNSLKIICSLSRLKKNIENYYNRCGCRNRHSFYGFHNRKSLRLNKCSCCFFYSYHSYYTCLFDYTNPFPIGCNYFKSMNVSIQLSLDL